MQGRAQTLIAPAPSRPGWPRTHALAPLFAPSADGSADVETRTVRCARAQQESQEPRGGSGGRGGGGSHTQRAPENWAWRDEGEWERAETRRGDYWEAWRDVRSRRRRAYDQAKQAPTFSHPARELGREGRRGVGEGGNEERRLLGGLEGREESEEACVRPSQTSTHFFPPVTLHAPLRQRPLLPPPPPPPW